MNNLGLKCQFALNNFIFLTKLVKEEREEPGFGMLHYKYKFVYIKNNSA